MRDLYTTLRLFSNPYNMDYCEDFDVIKSICEYANKDLKQFSKIQFRGGNEDTITEIINRIQKHFISKNYFDNKEDNNVHSEFGQNLRKITFFLMLNTDVSYKYDLNDDQYISHLLGILPQLSTCLLVHLIWGLNLQEYFYEVVSYSPCWFSFQFVSAAISSIKYLDPYSTLKTVENLVKAVLLSVSRSEIFELDAIDQKIILGKLHDFVMDLLRQFYTPDREKFSHFSRWEFYKYSGFALKHILDIILFSFDTFETLPTEKIEDKYRIYYICRDKCHIKADVLQSQRSDIVVETLKKLITALLNTLQYNAMLVKIDVFMHWVEVDLNEDETLQSVVGGQSYKVLEIMHSKKIFAHSVAEHLKFISIRPKTLEERLKDAKLGDILCKIDDEEFHEKKHYFNELLQRGELVFGNDECLDTILSNTKLMSVVNCLNILEYIKSSIVKEFDNDDDYGQDGDICQKVIGILLKSLQNFNSEQLEEINLYYIKLNGYQSNILEQKDLNQRCNEFFNKYSSVFDTQTFLQLSVENPSKLWKLFFDEGCGYLQHVQNFCTTLKSHPKLGKYFVWDLLKSSFPEKCSKKFYPNLLADICNTDIIEKDSFFKEFIYKNVLDTLERDSYNELLVLFSALIRIANNSPTCFGNVTAPILVMAGEVLEKCRWDLVTYEDVRDEIVKSTIEFIQIVSGKFLSSASEKDTILSNTKLMSVVNCLNILEYIKSSIVKEFDNDDDYGQDGDICQKVIGILLKSLQNFNSEQLEEINLYYIKLNGYQSNILEQKDLNQRCNEFFNKYSSVFDTQTFLQLSVENPSKLWKLFFDEGCGYLQHVQNFCTTLKSHPKLGKYFVWDLLKSSFPEKCSKKFYPNLLADICNTDIIEKDSFFKEFIYKNVLDTLERDSYNELLVLFSALIRIANNSPTCFGNVTAPILVMAGEVLEKCRWDLVTYEDVRDEIVKSTIEFIQIVSGKFLSSASEKDRKWINNKIRDHRPITRYYFQKFSLKQGQPVKYFDEYIQTGTNSTNTEKDDLEKFLTGVYVRCTSKEISWLSKNPALLKLFPEVILIIEKIVKDLGDDNAINNFRYCIVNYINVLKKTIIPDLKGKTDEAIDLGFKTLKLVDRSPRSIYDEIYMNFQQIILDIFEKSAPIEEEVIKNVNRFVANMQDCKGKELLHEKFQAMAIETLMSSYTNPTDQ